MEVKELLIRMLQKNPEDRISIIDALNHPWFNIVYSSDHQFLDKGIIQKLIEFRAPQRLQVEALTFLVNNLGKDVIDFKSLREAFRTLDK